MWVQLGQQLLLQQLFGLQPNTSGTPPSASRLLLAVDCPRLGADPSLSVCLLAELVVIMDLQGSVRVFGEKNKHEDDEKWASCQKLSFQKVLEEDRNVPPLIGPP